ncbi:hypothetical protein [Streptomyces sp. NPDC005805]|uniref:hypothetical protein n=1 Tax=Streptomyces sp. NPDC005805 TaxID=3157068 RepID=UPI0034079561
MRIRGGGRTGRTLLTAVTLAAALTTTGCGALLLDDKGPLPPRPAAVPADTVVTELTAALAAEGVPVERAPRDGLPDCYERLTGRHAAQTADRALRAAFERVRADHGWGTGPDQGEGVLSAKRGNWVAMASLQGPAPGPAEEAVITVSLVCSGPSAAPSSPPPPPPPSTEPAPASS